MELALRAATEGASGAWELLYFKAPGPVQSWLATHGWPVAPTYHNDIRVQHIALDQGPMRQAPIDVFFGEALELRSAVDAARAVPAISCAFLRLGKRTARRRNTSSACVCSGRTDSLSRAKDHRPAKLVRPDQSVGCRSSRP